jgi:N-acetylmuramoyl-L-alanine amidase
MTVRPVPPDPLEEQAPAARPASTPRPRTRSARRAAPSNLSQAVRALGTIVVSGMVIATLFTWWTPSSFLPAESAGALAVALATQSSAAQATPLVATESPANRVGIVAGHQGIHARTGLPDPGAICDDGLTEVSVNTQVADLVAERLRTEGYTVDLLDEFDERLNGYQAAALVSIHSDSCEYVNDTATGYKVAAVVESQIPDRNARLVGCLVARYAQHTGLNFHPSVTFDMTQYHTFYEIAPTTPGAIIEIGFLNLDRALLTEQPERVAAGVSDGILCFLRNEPIEGQIAAEEAQ